MNGEEIKRRVQQAIEVAPQMIVLAKTKVLAETQTGVRGTEDLIAIVLEQHGCMRPLRVDVRSGEDTSDNIAACARSASWREATTSAVWGLIADGLLIPADVLSEGRTCVHWSIQSNGGSSGSTFYLALPGFPAQVGPLRTARTGQGTLLSSGDIYLEHLNAPGMHKEIQDATRECVACFRRGLFAGSVALLGKVSEGAWIQLGEALVDKMPCASSSEIANQRDVLANSQTGPMRKIKAVKELLLRQEYQHVREATGFGAGVFEQAVQWSDLVRGSRNSIHFGATPTVPNTYESVGVLLMAGQQHLGFLYRIRATVLS